MVGIFVWRARTLEFVGRPVRGAPEGKETVSVLRRGSSMTKKISKRGVGCPLLVMATLLWAVLSGLFFERLGAVILSQETILCRMVAALIIAWVVVSLFYACFHTVSFAFSLWARRSGFTAPRDYGSTPPVAVLYPCMNDLKRKSVVSLLEQDYENYRDCSRVAEKNERKSSANNRESLCLAGFRPPRHDPATGL